MSLKIVISQPMYFPWVGFISQIAMADIVVWLDDAPFSKGSFTNRVQLKNQDNISWLTIPLLNKGKNSLIGDLKPSCDNFVSLHKNKLENLLRSCDHKNDALDLFERAWLSSQSLCQSIITSTELIIDELEIKRPQFLLSSSLPIFSLGSQRVLEIVQHLGGKCYITGHGAKNYLQHEDFEKAKIDVEYMVYGPYQWQQQAGPFNPFVSSLDLIANVDSDERKNCLYLKTKYWKRFLPTN